MLVFLLFASDIVVSAPAIKIIGAVSELNLNKDMTQSTDTFKDLSGTEFVNIAGKWDVTESMTYTCNLDGDTFTDTESGSGIVDIFRMVVMSATWPRFYCA